MKKFRQLIIGLAIALGALYYTLRGISFEEFAQSFKTVEYVYLIPSLLMVMFSFVARTYRWRILLLPIKEFKVSQIYSPLMVGTMGNILPARAGDVLRSFLIGSKYKVSFTGTFATVIMEHLADLVMVLLLFAWVLMFHAEVFTSQVEFSGWSVQNMAVKFGQLSATAVVVLIIFIYLMTWHKDRLMVLVRWCLRPLPHKWRDKVAHLVDQFGLGVVVVKNVPALIKIVFYTILVWVGILLSYYPLYWAYDLNSKTLESLLILNIMVAVLITVLPTPAFLGSFQAGVLIALHHIMGESEIAAVSFGMVAWALNFIVILGAGIYFILHDHLSVKQLVEVEEAGEEALERKD